MFPYHISFEEQQELTRLENAKRSGQLPAHQEDQLTDLRRKLSRLLEDNVYHRVALGEGQEMRRKELRQQLGIPQSHVYLGNGQYQDAQNTSYATAASYGGTIPFGTTPAYGPAAGTLQPLGGSYLSVAPASYGYGSVPGNQTTGQTASQARHPAMQPPRTGQSKDSGVGGRRKPPTLSTDAESGQRVEKKRAPARPLQGLKETDRWIPAKPTDYYFSVDGGGTGQNVALLKNTVIVGFKQLVSLELWMRQRANGRKAHQHEHSQEIVEGFQFRPFLKNLQSGEVEDPDLFPVDIEPPKHIPDGNPTSLNRKVASFTIGMATDALKSILVGPISRRYRLTFECHYKTELVQRLELGEFDIRGSQLESGPGQQ